MMPTCITKWPISNNQLKLLAKCINFHFPNNCNIFAVYQQKIKLITYWKELVDFKKTLQESAYITHYKRIKGFLRVKPQPNLTSLNSSKLSGDFKKRFFLLYTISCTITHTIFKITVTRSSSLSSTSCASGCVIKMKFAFQKSMDCCAYVHGVIMFQTISNLQMSNRAKN